MALIVNDYQKILPDMKIWKKPNEGSLVHLICIFVRRHRCEVVRCRRISGAGNRERRKGHL